MTVLVGISGSDVEDHLLSAGSSWKIRSLSAYGESHAMRFALVMHPGDGTKQRVYPYLDALGVEARLEQGLVDGYEPIILTCSKGFGVPAYALVLERRPDAKPVRVETMVSRRRLLGAPIPLFNGGVTSNIVTELVETRNANLRWIDTFNAAQGLDPYADGPEFYCAIFEEFPVARRAWALTMTDLAPNLTYAGNAAIEGMRLAWGRLEATVPVVVAPSGAVRVMAWWRDDVYRPIELTPSQFDPGVVNVGPMRESEVGNVLSSMLSTGHIPLTVSASGSGDRIRFGAVLSTGRFAPLNRAFRMVEQRQPAAVSSALTRSTHELERFADQLARVEAAAEEAGGLREIPGAIAIDVTPDGLESCITHTMTSTTSQVSMDRMPGRIVDRSPTERLPLDVSRYGLAVPRSWTAMDTAVRALMLRDGARACQLAIARNGQLKLARSYTFAEDGYPELTLDHKMRPASACKSLTALAIVRGYGPSSPSARGFATDLADALNVPHDAPQRDMLEALTVSHLVRQRSGWGLSGETFTTEEVLPELGRSRWALGDYQRYLSMTSDPLLISRPGTVVAYNNANYAVLGEIVSRRLAGVNFQRYERAMQLFLGFPLNGSRASIASDSWQEAMAADECNVHVRWMGYSVSEDGEMIPAMYGRNPAPHAGAGQWCMSMVDLCRVISGLDVRAARPTTTTEELEAVLSSWTFDVRNDDGTSASYLDKSAFGFGGTEATFRFAGRLVQVRYLEMFGQQAGGTCFFRHYISPQDTLTVAIGFNVDNMGSMDALVDAVETHESERGWPVGDAFV